VQCQTKYMCPNCAHFYSPTDIESLYLNAAMTQKHSQRMMSVFNKINEFKKMNIQSKELPTIYDDEPTYFYNLGPIFSADPY